MNSPVPRHAVVLFGHGSRDPLWRQPIEAVAARMQQLAPDVLVRCAYLELTEPDLPTAAAELAASGIASLSVVPLFLGVGRHAREDLPMLITELRLRYAAISISLKPAIGEDAQIVNLIAELSLQR
ncbi:sirohydrochlorin chelatase [Rhodoferax sp.]|uniref:sirohydrochlorin chelatase n=1 Tax=Rhodoferax sp. TaxID=50421 RepID=UPI002755BD52|nr:CbiX/SirB N-terminal domain-containing protein [Rhodoferax sp.]